MHNFLKSGSKLLFLELLPLGVKEVKIAVYSQRKILSQNKMLPMNFMTKLVRFHNFLKMLFQDLHLCEGLIESENRIIFRVVTDFIPTSQSEDLNFMREFSYNFLKLGK